LKAIENIQIVRLFFPLSIGYKVAVKIFSHLTLKWEKLNHPYGGQLQHAVATVPPVHFKWRFVFTEKNRYK
jgi:hypothetical protein